MTQGHSIRRASFAILLALFGAQTLGAQMLAAAEQSTPIIGAIDSEAKLRKMSLGIGKAVIIDLPADVKDVLVADPTIANAVIRSSRRAYMIGVKAGQSSIFFFDIQGRQIVGFDIAVTRDLNGLRATLKQMFPHSDIRAEGLGDGVVLSGSAANQGEAQQAYDMALQLAGDSKVTNNIVLRDRDQVMLKVTVAEVQRDVIKQLGINLSGSIGGGSSVVTFNTDNPFSAYGTNLSNTDISGSFRNITAQLRAMERAGVIRTLAEPNLTAVSGETASFVAGGEVPIPTGLSCDSNNNCQPQISFKKFGVSLAFTPVVLSAGRISMKVMTEVSELSPDGTVTVRGSGTSATVPSVRTRRAETVVEIPSGGALAMAGMIQEQTKQQINGLPGLMQLPILGTLFRSRDYVNRQTELMILVTPYVVRATAQQALSRPDDGFADAPDSSTVLLGRLNRIYGIKGKVDPRKMFHGNVGFILD
jgi:pilus assembly protein CpaC